MLKKIQDILIQKHSKNKLAHFYLLSCNEFPQGLNQRIAFLDLFMKELITLMTGLKNTQHPDILWIKNQTDDKNYSVSSLRESSFFEFLNLKNFSLKWRFIVIQNVHKLGDTVSNMLLKSLEEPSNNTSIFLLNPSKEKLLATVEGRAIKIKISPLEGRRKEFQLFKELDTLSLSQKSKTVLSDYYHKKSTVTEVLEVFRQNRAGQDVLIEFLLSQECSSFESSYELKKNFLDCLMHFENSLKFNNSHAERFLPLLSI